MLDILEERVELKETEQPITQESLEIEESKEASREMWRGVIIVLSFIFFVDSVVTWADMTYESGWLNILKFPITFLFATGGIILWSVLGVGLVLWRL